MAAYGLGAPWTVNGATSKGYWGFGSSLRVGDVQGALANLKQSIPIIGNDSSHATNRALVGTGAAVVVGGRVVKRIAPWIRRTFRIKLSRHHLLSLV